MESLLIWVVASLYLVLPINLLMLMGMRAQVRRLTQLREAPIRNLQDRRRGQW